jgi:hypothetical protein
MAESICCLKVANKEEQLTKEAISCQLSFDNRHVGA